MVRHIASLSLLLVALLLLPALAADAKQNTKVDPATGAELGERTELWTGEIYSSSYRAAVCVRPDGSMRGDLLLRLNNGQVDEYHFTGRVDGSDVEARHGSGHRFKGTLRNDAELVGSIRLSNGMSIKLKGTRLHGIRVNPDCSPAS